MANLEEEMVATYTTTITGIARTKKEMAALDNEIKLLRAGDYGASSATAAGRSGDSDIFETAIDNLSGRVQTAASKSMLAGMDLGKSIQTQALQAATTPTGESGKSHVGGREGPGRDDSGDMIKALARNVETDKTPSATFITGWHGWRDSRNPVFEYQEDGTRGRGGNHSLPGGNEAGSIRRARRGKKSKGNVGVPAANSLGKAIIPVREFLIRELGYLKK